MDDALYQLRELRTEVAEMKAGYVEIRGWLQGDVSKNGEREPGLLDHVKTFRVWKNWVVGLLGAIALACLTEAALDVFRTLFHPGGK